MTTMSKIQRPKGTQDTIEHVADWQQLEAMVRQTLSLSGYRECRTPLLEHTELFLRGVGDTTDIVNKEMYTFEKGDRSLTLRPEGTAGTVRAFMENGMSRWPKPVRLFYIGPMFRYERPQAGRLRQFHQVGVEQFGLDTPESDLEILTTAISLLQNLGLSGLSLQLNNLGTADDREQFKQQLRETLQPVKADLCDTCQTRFDINPLRMLDCKNTGCQAIYQGPLLADLLKAEFAGEASQAHFVKVCDGLDRLGIPFARNRQLVRGLDYYTGLVFEIVADNGQLGAQNVVCGGGRYNGLVRQLGGPDTPAVGFAFGIERLLALLPQAQPPQPNVYVVTDNLPDMLPMVQALRTAGLAVWCDITGKNFGKQLENAARSGAQLALISGATERAEQQVQVKLFAGANPDTNQPVPGVANTVSRQALVSVLTDALKR
jgi:histidyl-tRNA synthetase